MDFTDFAAGSDDGGRRADRVLRRFLYDANLSSVYGALRKGLILVNAQRVKPDARIESGDVISIASFLLQNEFQSFLIVAEKPKLGLALTVAAGLTNIVLDAIFVAIFRWGLAGAAWATVISECVGGLVPLTYFIKPNKTPLRLTKTKFDLRV